MNHLARAMIGCLAAMTISAAACASHSPEHETEEAKDEPRPFDEARDAMADVDDALSAAALRGTRVLLVLGGNWCHDSRGLAAKFEEPALATLIAWRFELVWVDVGRRDRNLEIAHRFGVDELLGTPTILIVAPDGTLLNADSVHDWRDAASRPPEDIFAYIESFARPAE